MSAIIALLIPLIPQLVQLTTGLITAAQQKGELTAAQAKVKMDELATRLDATVAAVKALEIRTV